jgi:hypothetical protein
MVEKKITADDVVRRVRRVMTEDRTPPQLTGSADASGSTSRPGVGFRNPMSAVGDLIRGGSSGAATRLGIGTTGQVLTVVAGNAAWAAAGGAAATRDLLTNGDATAPELIFAGGDVIWIEG